MISIESTARTRAIVAAVIEAAFKDAAIEQVPCKAEYHNGTGYFNPLADSDIGGMTVKMVDHDGRRILVIPNPRRNVVLFERYSGPDNKNYGAHYDHEDLKSIGYITKEPMTGPYDGAADMPELYEFLKEFADLSGLKLAA